MAKYKVGDKVRIKRKTWIDMQQKNRRGRLKTCLSNSLTLRCTRLGYVWIL
jgi:hypothetical protein